MQPREVLLLDELMQARFEALLRSNTGVAAALQYSRSRPPVNVLPLFDSLKDDEAEELMRGDAGGVSAAGGGRGAARLSGGRGGRPPRGLALGARPRWAPAPGSPPVRPLVPTHPLHHRPHPHPHPNAPPLPASAPPRQLCHPKPSEERLRWKVYYPGQIIAALGSSLDHVVVISKGSVKMRFPVGKGPHGRSDEHTVVASVGERRRAAPRAGARAAAGARPSAHNRQRAPPLLTSTNKRHAKQDAAAAPSSGCRAPAPAQPHCARVPPPAPQATRCACAS